MNMKEDFDQTQSETSLPKCKMTKVAGKEYVHACLSDAWTSTQTHNSVLRAVGFDAATTVSASASRYFISKLSHPQNWKRFTASNTLTHTHTPEHQAKGGHGG